MDIKINGNDIKKPHTIVKKDDKRYKSITYMNGDTERQEISNKRVINITYELMETSIYNQLRALFESNAYEVELYLNEGGLEETLVCDVEISEVYTDSVYNSNNMYKDIKIEFRQK